MLSKGHKMGTLKAKSFRCEPEVWKKFKLICTIEGDAIQDKLGDLVNEYVESKFTDTTNQNQISVTRPNGTTGNATQ